MHISLLEMQEIWSEPVDIMISLLHIVCELSLRQGEDTNSSTAGNCTNIRDFESRINIELIFST